MSGLNDRADLLSAHSLSLRAFPHGQYKTGKTLGSGTYAVVKEAVHIVTGKVSSLIFRSTLAAVDKSEADARPPRVPTPPPPSFPSPSTTRARRVELFARQWCDYVVQ